MRLGESKSHGNSRQRSSWIRPGRSLRKILTVWFLHWLSYFCQPRLHGSAVGGLAAITVRVARTLLSPIHGACTPGSPACPNYPT